MRHTILRRSIGKRAVLAGAALVTLALIASGCSLVQRLDPTVKASCSIVGNDRFDLSYTRGPELTPEELLETSQGKTLDAFFNGGPGEVEGGGYLEADGFSIVSKNYVLGYKDGRLVSDFTLGRGDVRRWGGCNPVLVRGDQTASRWHLAEAPDPDATVIPILVQGGACVGGGETDIITEIVEIVTQDEDAVVVTAWTRESNMPGMCAGIGVDLEAEIVMEGPLGDRQLIDGGLVPPAPIEDGR